MTQNRKLIEPDTIPFEGGQDTYHEPALLPSGSYSLIQNIRKMHPGFKQRPGYIKKHSTADGTNGVKSMFQFSKGKRTERHFYAQMSDGDVLEATDAPPAVTTGVFGSEVHDGSANQIPASWGVLNDLLIYSNGVDQHQLCAGDVNTVDKLIVYDSNNKMDFNPSDGYDYTSEATGDGVVPLDNLGNFIPIAGTVACTLSGTDLTGTGTNFINDLTVGQPIWVQDVQIPQYPTDHTSTYVKATTGTGGIATNPTKSLTGVATGNAWIATAATNQKLNIDLGSAKTITELYYENYHNVGKSTGAGAKTFKLYGSASAEDFSITEWNGYVYPPTQNDTYVKSSYDADYQSWYSTTPTEPLTGAALNNSWRYSSTTNLRFHIDLGSALTVTQIYYENYHNLGANTDLGVRNFTFWGSNSATAFAEMTYGTDTDWTQLTTSASAFDQHTASDVADPKYITVTNTTAYRYYAFKFADNYGGATYMGARRMELRLTSGWVELPCSQNTFDEHKNTDQRDPKYITVTNSTEYRYYSVAVYDNHGHSTNLALRRIELYITGTNTEVNVIDSITSATVATVKNAWGASYATKTIKTTQDCLLICAPVMPNKITYTVSAVNGNTVTAYVGYYSTSGWKTLTATDNTSVTSKTLAQTGTMTWTQPTDATAKYMYGINGFWVKVAFSAALDSEVELSAVTYGSAFTPLVDLWDGVLVDSPEAQIWDDSAELFTTYATSNITLNDTTADDEIYFNSYDQAIAVYVDMGSTPNKNVATIDHLEYLNSEGSWTSVGTYTDETGCFTKSGFIFWNPITNLQRTQFNGSNYSSCWFRLGVSTTLSANVSASIQVLPIYDVGEFGKGICNAVWRDRAVYVFDKDPSYLYISASGSPQVLSGDDSAIFQVGDGRANKVVAMKPFYDALLCCQEEKGATGGCVTLVTGDTPATLKKYNISNYYGALNSQCLEVVETLEGGNSAFILSKKGILRVISTGAYTDSRSINFVPNFDKVRNYFDPSSSDCIRAGYESKMYLKHDSVYNILKIGLTTGTTATENNVFLVYDLLSGEFSKDVYANNFACEVECDAASGNVPSVRLAGGQADGTVYILNTGLNDISSAVNASTTIEFNNRGMIIRDAEMIIRVKAQTTGNMTLTPYTNGVAVSGASKTLSLTAARTGDRVRRHRVPLNFVDQNISINLSHNTISESFYLLDYGINLEEYSEQ